MSDEIISWKLPIPGGSINPLALYKWLKSKGKRDQIAKVAERFLRLFELHGIGITEIPHFLPHLTLDKFMSPEALLPALTHEVLEQACNLFGVRRSWLDAVDERIYECVSCYKQPKLLFERLSAVAEDGNLVPLRALYASKGLDEKHRRSQPITLVIVEKIGELGSEDIYRYLPFRDEWEWNYPKSRIQLKAMVRLVSEVMGSPVPLYRVSRTVVHRVAAGLCVPRQYLQGSLLTEPSLEDHALSLEESAVAKECEELPDVLAYIGAFNLDTIAFQVQQQRQG